MNFKRIKVKSGVLII